MMPTSPAAASPIQLPKVDIEEPVAVIPAASVAGDTDGDRINTFILAPQERDGMGALAGKTADDLRNRVTGKPFTYLAAAFSLGYVVARMLR